MVPGFLLVYFVAYILCVILLESKDLELSSLFEGGRWGPRQSRRQKHMQQKEYTRQGEMEEIEE